MMRLETWTSLNGFEHLTNLFVYCLLLLLPASFPCRCGTPNAMGYGMKHLRERGIYLAPNGQSFVASRERITTSDGKRILSQLGNRLSCFLFGRYEWAFHGTPAYEVAPTGSLVALKQPWGFPPDQLVDTGATAGAH